jgi:UDP-N-acetylglucosamine acyltransferase
MVHATAIVDAAARVADGVSIGAYAVVGPEVEVGAGTTIGPHCVITGPTRIGRDNRIHAHAALGGDPQDKKFAGERGELVIGDRNTIREFTTFSRGTGDGGGVTRVGDDNWIMAYVHIAHDCQIGHHVVIANSVQLAGHIHIGDWAILGGLSAVHQFVRIGAHAMIGGTSSVRQDIPPYMIGAGDPFRPVGINSEGLSRRGFSAEDIAALKEAYKLLYRRKLNIDQACEAMTALQAEQPEGAAAVQALLDFLMNSSRGIVRP